MSEKVELDLAMPAAPLEMQEFLYAQTTGKRAVSWYHECREKRYSTPPFREFSDDVRRMLRLHRFGVIAWLAQNGVKIPVSLLADSNHPEVGNQCPDQNGNSLVPTGGSCAEESSQ